MPAHDPARPQLRLLSPDAAGAIRRAGPVLVLVAAMLSACTPANPATRPGGDVMPGPSVAPVVRSVLAEAIPDEARSLDLQLVRYVIQPDTTLATHHHPGTQVALIESGRLTYTVVTGEVVVHQADGGSRTIRAGSTDVIVAGEWIVEREPVIHFGANLTREVVVILATTLLREGQPASITDPTPVPSGR
jgi:quercetin dioxygenase-like cupin family protein